MSRIMLADFEADVKALKRSSKLMRNREFGGLVQVVDKFHRDVKLSSLTIKDRTQLIHLGEDAQFFRILVRMLHEVTVTTGMKQREDLKKVTQWYQKNKEILHGHPHFKGANKELYKKPNLSFSKDAIRHYAQPLERNKNKKKVVIATNEPNRSKSAVTLRKKSTGGANKVEGSSSGGGVIKEGSGVTTSARPLTAPPGLHRPKITNGLPSGDNSNNMKMVLEENSFMVNYVNDKLSAYNNDTMLPRASSVIGVTTDGHEPDMSESDVSRLTTPTASYDSFTHHPPPLSAHQLPESHSHSPTTAAQQQHQVLNQNREQYENGSDYDFMAESSNGVVELDERGLPKVVHPLTSLITPFSNAVVNEEIMIEESYHGGQPPDKRNKSPLKLHINVPVGDNEHMSSMSVDEQKATNLQKWKEFQARQAFEQELAAKQAFFGRGGDPTGIRYTGYEGGSDMPEWYTYDVISSYAEGEGLVQQNARTGDAFTGHPLEQFYQDTEKFSPPVRPPSSMSREGATPMSPSAATLPEEEFDGRGYIPDEMALEMQNRISVERERDRTSSPSVHFESVVDLAGPVSDSMAMNKELISPEPQLGFRQPALAITVKPPPTIQIQTQGSHQQPPTSPPMSSPPASQQSVYKMAPERASVQSPMVAPPNSFSNSSKSGPSEYTQRNRRGEPIISYPEESEYTVHFKRKQRPVTAAIIPNPLSSRQAIKAQNSPAKSKWGVESLGEDQLGKLERTKSAPIAHRRRSLRSAGSTSGGRRPRTAVINETIQHWSVQQDNDQNERVPQAASHIATTMHPRAVSSLMIVNPLGGDNNKRGARSRMGYRGLKGYDESLPGFLPDMQFLSITGPAPVQARGQEDGVGDDVGAASIDSQTPSDNASTHPLPDNLSSPAQQWNGLSISTENQEQLSDPFSSGRKADTDSLAGGDANSIRSRLSSSGLEDGEGTDRMNDLIEDLEESEGGGSRANSAINDNLTDDEENDTPRTMDADLDSDLEQAAEFDGDADDQRNENEVEENKSVCRTIDVDMRSVSHANTEFDGDEDDDQSAIGSQMLEEEELTSALRHDDDEQTNVTKDPDGREVHDDARAVDFSGDAPDDRASVNEQKYDDECEQLNSASVTGELDLTESGMSAEMDILTGAEKADLLSRSFLAVTRNRRVERPSSAQPRLCAAHRQQRNNVNLHQVRPTSARALSPGRENAAQYSGGAFYPHGWRPGSSESVRSLPVGLTYMPLADEHRQHLEKTVPILDRAGFPMMPAVSKKPLTPRSSPSGSPRHTPVNSVGGSPRSSRESFGGSSNSLNASPLPLVMKIHLGNHSNDASENEEDSSYHFQPITAGENGEEEHCNEGAMPNSPAPPHILVRKPSSAQNMQSIEDAKAAISPSSGSSSPSSPSFRPTSARHRSVSPSPTKSPRPSSARNSPRSLSPNLDTCRPKSPCTLSPRPTSGRRSASPQNLSFTSPRPSSARASLSPRPKSATPSTSPRPRSASPRSSPRPSSANELRATSPVPQRPSSPRGQKKPEWKGRPLPTYGVYDPDVQEEQIRKQKAAKEAVRIQSLFCKSSSKGHKKEMNRQERERQERKRKEWMEQQKNYNEHMWKVDMALVRRDNMHDKNWERDYMSDKLMKDRMRREKWDDLKQQRAMENRRAQSYLKRIGPTVDIWDMFNGEKRGVTKMQFKKAVMILQKFVRGWIVRTMLKRVIKKSRVHAASFKSFIKYYNELLKRIARWHGIKKPRIHADLWDMDVFMDRKRYYESVFVNRTHPGDEMDYKDIDMFFKECDHYPSKREIYNALLGATKKDPDKPHLKLKEKDVVESAFMIYVPKATGLKTENLRKSTWLNPLVDGEEARKLMGSEHVEQTSYLTSIQFVAKSLQERKARQLEEIKMEAKQAEKAEAKRLADERAAKASTILEKSPWNKH